MKAKYAVSTLLVASQVSDAKAELQSSLPQSIDYSKSRIVQLFENARAEIRNAVARMYDSDIAMAAARHELYSSFWEIDLRPEDDVRVLEIRPGRDDATPISKPESELPKPDNLALRPSDEELDEFRSNLGKLLEKDDEGRKTYPEGLNRKQPKQRSFNPNHPRKLRKRRGSGRQIRTI